MKRLAFTSFSAILSLASANAYGALYTCHFDTSQGPYKTQVDTERPFETSVMKDESGLYLFCSGVENEKGLPAHMIVCGVVRSSDATHPKIKDKNLERNDNWITSALASDQSDHVSVMYRHGPQTDLNAGCRLEK